MKKKGFTLVELLAVIVILGIILLIAVPKLMDVIENAKLNSFLVDEQMIVKATKSYIELNDEYLPKNMGETKEISLSTLKTAEYINPIISPFDKAKECNGYVIIKKINNSDYEYTPKINCSNNIESVESDGLFLDYSFDDYVEPTKNIIPNGQVNAYPTLGNTWGTYNDNQYNNNVYFSIGTIDSVSNNIVTLSNIGRPIYTYDVLTPQTSGGGVTAGTNYFIKKLTSNTFALYPYNSSQDGSLGFKVYDSINNDLKISINSTNFPTMWYGKPHLPNSALVKEIIKDGFNLNGKVHDCIRLHTEHKLGGGADGMAYSVTPYVTSGNTYTYSFYYRAVDTYSIGKTIYLELYTNGNYWSIPKSSFTITSTNWQRFTATMVAPNTGDTSLYLFPSKGSTLDISEIQVEQKAYVTPFTATERNDAVIDHSTKGNNAPLVLATTPKWVDTSYLGDGAYLFNGTNSIISVPNSSSLNSSVITMSAWINPTLLIPSTHQRIITKNNTSGYMLNIYDTRIESYIGGDHIVGPIINTNEWIYAVVTIENSTLKLYINGKLYSSKVYTGTIDGGTSNLTIGSAGTSYFNGYLDEIKIYNRALTPDEINETYNISLYKHQNN